MAGRLAKNFWFWVFLLVFVGFVWLTHHRAHLNTNSYSLSECLWLNASCSEAAGTWALVVAGVITGLVALGTFLLEFGPELVLERCEADTHEKENVVLVTTTDNTLNVEPVSALREGYAAQSFHIENEGRSMARNVRVAIRVSSFPLEIRRRREKTKKGSSTKKVSVSLGPIRVHGARHLTLCIEPGLTPLVVAFNKTAKVDNLPGRVDIEPRVVQQGGFVFLIQRHAK